LGEKDFDLERLLLRDWLKLLYIKSIPLAAKRSLVNHFGSPGDIFRADRHALLGCGLVNCTAIDAILNSRFHGVETDGRKLESLGCSYIGFTDQLFPRLLNEIPGPPLGLFTRGNIELLGMRQIAIVGSRNASPAGKKTTEWFARELSRLGFVITSGMASGIDSFAHQACMDYGGQTIAVLGTGIDIVYPRSNTALSRRISTSGLVVTEYTPGMQPRRKNFPQRNRIISGLSVGTLVVEAGVRSGSLITARLAGEQGREVFAIPGSIYNPTSRGCHQLIRQGAKLVENTADILEELGHFTADDYSSLPDPAKSFNSSCEIPVYNLIDYAPTLIDEIIEGSGLTPEQVSSILVDLELRGLISEHNGMYQRLP
jgi:DNA processing protein